MNILIQWTVNAAALLLLSELIDSVKLDNITTAFISAVVLGLVNVLLKPILLIITLPINFLSLGFFTLVINGLMFWLAAAFVPGFQVSGFWAALWGAILYSVICWAINTILSHLFQPSGRN